MRIWVQKSASMQKRTSPLKFGDLAEKSGLNSVSDLSTKGLHQLRGDGDPLRAVAYREDWFMKLITSQGLRVDSIRHGAWSGNQSAPNWQDYLVLSKETSHASPQL